MLRFVGSIKVASKSTKVFGFGKFSFDITKESRKRILNSVSGVLAGIRSGSGSNSFSALYKTNTSWRALSTTSNVNVDSNTVRPRRALFYGKRIPHVVALSSVDLIFMQNISARK